MVAEGESEAKAIEAYLDFLETGDLDQLSERELWGPIKAKSGRLEALARTPEGRFLLAVFGWRCRPDD